MFASLFVDELVHMRQATAAAGAGAASVADGAPAGRASSNGGADGTIADSVTVADEHGEDLSEECEWYDASVDPRF